MEKELGSCCVSDEGKCCAGGSCKRDVNVAEGKEQRKETERHTKNASQKHGACDDGLDRPRKS